MFKDDFNDISDDKLSLVLSEAKDCHQDILKRIDKVRDKAYQFLAVDITVLGFIIATYKSLPLYTAITGLVITIISLFLIFRSIWWGQSYSHGISPEGLMQKSFLEQGMSLVKIGVIEHYQDIIKHDFNVLNTLDKYRNQFFIFLGVGLTLFGLTALLS